MTEQMPGVDPAVPPSGTGCVECEAAGGWWLHLRRCTQCGHIGCCDTSPSQHATAHAKETGHPVIRSFEPGETWFWSYPSRGLLRDGPGPGRPGGPPEGAAGPGPARPRPRRLADEAERMSVISRGFTGRRRDDPSCLPASTLSAVSRSSRRARPRRLLRRYRMPMEMANSFCDPPPKRVRR